MIYALVSYDDAGKVNQVFQFDCINSFKESWSANVAKTAVQGGISVTDNIALENPKFSISSIISRYSLSTPSQRLVWDGEGFNFAEDGVDFDRHITARNTLRDIFLAKSIFTLLETDQYTVSTDPQTAYDEMMKGNSQEYKNCCIANFDIDVSAGGFNAFFLSLNLEQLNIVDLAVRDLAPEEMSPTLKPLVKKEVNAGQASTSTSTSNDKKNPSKKVSEKGSDTKVAKEVNKKSEAAATDKPAKPKTRPAHLNNDDELAQLEVYRKANATKLESGRVVVYEKNGVWYAEGQGKR